jgi:tetratricopeptide (TPR) repeat protein
LSRDTILDAVWDGDPESIPAFWEAGRHLRRLLGEGSWGRQAGSYALRAPVHDESRQFDELAAIVLDRGLESSPRRAEPGDSPASLGRLEAAERALQIVAAGSYLEWSDSTWAMTERNRIAGRVKMVTLALAQLYLESGRCANAIATWRHAIAVDPVDEAPCLALLQHLIITGQAHMARDEYDAYRRLLRAELQTEPSTQLRALAASLEA